MKMIKKITKNKILIICFAITTLSPQILNIIYAESSSEDHITRTAKITFFKNEEDSLEANIIPYTSDGYRPKSGLITCEIIDSDITRIYYKKLKNQKKIEGYFVATYKKIEKDKSTLILRFKGELLKIEPWDPPFIEDSR